MMIKRAASTRLEILALSGVCAFAAILMRSYHTEWQNKKGKVKTILALHTNGHKIRARLFGVVSCEARGLLSGLT
jgi:hypothetical protein